MLSALPELPVYNLWPLELSRGEGCRVWDANGREYLDMYGGHAVASLGHAHPVWAEAIAAQARSLTFYSNVADLAVRRDFAKRLVERVGVGMVGVFFSNSGAEANENALTLARTVTGRKTVVSVEGGFHGRTLLLSAIGGIEGYRKRAAAGGESLFLHRRELPFDDIDAPDAIVDEDVAAVIVEPVQGIAGARPCSHAFLQALRKRTRDTGSLLIFDEVQCGAGRCGAYTVAEREDVFPDILTLAKGLAGGFPVGATLCTQAVAEYAEPGLLGSTFGGGPLASAAGVATLDILEKENLVDNARARGEQIFRGLEAISGVLDVRGRGLLLGFRTERPSKEITAALREEHAILAGGCMEADVTRILPPFGLSESEASRFLEALSSILG